MIRSTIILDTLTPQTIEVRRSPQKYEEVQKYACSPLDANQLFSRSLRWGFRIEAPFTSKSDSQPKNESGIDHDANYYFRVVPYVDRKYEVKSAQTPFG